MLAVKTLLHDGFKRSAKLTGMEKKGLVAHHSVLKAIEHKIGQLQAELEKAKKEFHDDFRNLAEHHGLDPHCPPDQYELDKKRLSVRKEFIPTDHTEDPEEAKKRKATETEETPEG